MEVNKLLNDRYEIEHILGRGGMAVVYRANDLILDRPVAIKVLREDFSKHPQFRERFQQEAKAVANLAHPNIVTVHDFGFDNDKIFIVMGYQNGTDLDSLLAEVGHFPVSAAIKLMIQACAGVGYAHRAGIIHCDIKPHNMLVTPDQRLKVTDFGIARAMSSIRYGEYNPIVWGSPQYFSPEQAAGRPPSPASDVYGLGVVFYQMLTGKQPFKGETTKELIHQHQFDQPFPPRNINPEISTDLEQIILKTLAKEPSARYRTADQLGRVLISHANLDKPKHSAEEDTKPRDPAPIIKPIKVPIESFPKKYYSPAKNPLDIDWLTVLLGLVTMIAVGGLIPFWLWVYFSLNPPIR